MIACLKVTSGSVKLSVKITSPNAKSKITAAYQSSSHSPLKNTRTIKKGQWIKMTRTGSNLSTLPLIVAAKKGANINRRLNTTSYEITASSPSMWHSDATPIRRAANSIRENI
mgnify:CR=1 FL=1